MRNAENTPVNPATEDVDNRPRVAPASPGIAMIDEGNALEEQGRITEAMARYEAAIQMDPRCARAHLNRGNILLADAKLDEARSAYQLAIACEPNYAAAHFNLGNLNARAGEFELALRNYQEAIGIKPDFADAFVAIGNAFDSLGRTAEAVDSYQRALTINPDYAEVHFNLGVLEMKQARHDEAIKRMRAAIELSPDFAQAHRTLGIALSKLENLDAAEASLRRALAIEPESEGILYDLAMILVARDKASQALPLLMPALERTATWPIKIAFISCVERLGFVVNDLRIRAALESAITEPWGRPYRLSRSALSLVVLDRRIGHCVRLVNSSWPARLPRAAIFGAGGLAALAEDSLLHAALEAAPVSTLEFERLLTCARRVLLETASSEQAPGPSDIAAIRFYTALAQQCFLNEYVFDCDDSENLSAAACRTTLLALLDTSAEVPPLLLLAVAAYFPLYTLRNASRLLDSNYPTPIDMVLRQQVQEPFEERALKVGIKRLTPISMGVSQEVRSQYEQNPYPRWAKLPKREQGLYFNSELRRSLPFGLFTPMPDDSAPEALIAGCGTGSHSVITAQRFRGIRVLAIDLSLSSISYAKRKTKELGITNIEYAQADILELGDIERRFDIIESVGVLHHLADPFAGWETLLSLLRPGGFMFLGLYSELARGHIVKSRKIIAERGYSGTLGDIRRFRQDLAVGTLGVEPQRLSQFSDFFSTSECRDLLFHVQEHRLNLGQIESFLTKRGLQFIGFEIDRSVLHQYRARFTDDPSGTELHNWASFEAGHPETFVAMYQFWIQKPR
jgi:tetratricopeptide (TPR) repeat protein/2-polyprenyl-3-methyl-5-hydroxy-6-metoxy-1,4-benzoquinol methylase